MIQDFASTDIVSGFCKARFHCLEDYSTEIFGRLGQKSSVSLEFKDAIFESFIGGNSILVVVS